MAVATEVDLRQPYGHVVHVNEMMSALARLGWDLSVFVPDPGGGRPATTASEAAPFCVIPVRVPRIPKLELPLYEARLAWEITRRHRESPYDVVYTRADLYSVGGWLAAAVNGLPHLTEINSLKADELRIAGRHPALTRCVESLEGFISRRSRVVIVVTEKLRELVPTVHGVSRDRCVVVQNGVNTDNIQPQEQPPPDAPVRAVFAGQLRPTQGVATLLEAAKQVSDVDFTIIGAGPSYRESVEQADRLGLRDRVSFRGAVPHEVLSDELSGHHFGLAPYVKAQAAKIGMSPVKVFTYLAAGLPVIASRVPGLEFLEDLGVGITVEPEDPAALADAVARLRDDSGLRREMSVRARRVAVESMDWRSRAKELDAALRRVVTRRYGSSQ
jgi:glycosyltransferase involved in cell wall biosynthesis